MFANKQALDVMAEQAEGQLYLVIEQTVVAVLGAYDEVLIQRADGNGTAQFLVRFG